MCVVAQGSSVQLLIAILVMLSYMLLVLKTAPYEEDSEDWSAFVACVALTLTTIGGFALMTDNQNARTYESKVLGFILIGINGVCIALEIIIVVVFDCDGLSRCKKICGGKVIETKNVDKLSRLTESMMSRRSTHAISRSGPGGGGAAGGDGGGVNGSKEAIFQTVRHSSDSEMNAVKLNPMIRLGNGSGGNENGNNVVLEMRSMKSNVVTRNLEEKLPDGWETAIDEKGDVYFWNEETLATTWVRPNSTKTGQNGNESNGSLTQVLPIAGSDDEAVQNNEKKKNEKDGDIRSWGTKTQSKPISKVVGTNSSLAITVMMLVGSFVVGGADAYAKMPDGCKGKVQDDRSCYPRKAVDELNADGSGTHSIYGPMKDWDMSLVTDLSRLFYGKAVAADLSNWDVSRVTTMKEST